MFPFFTQYYAIQYSRIIHKTITTRSISLYYELPVHYINRSKNEFPVINNYLKNGVLFKNLHTKMNYVIRKR